jgi:TonB-linked SusC/RagA family outer membrane protein
MFSVTFAQTRQVTGKVTGPDNQGVATATIKIKGSNAATAAAADGSFTISAPAGSFVLQVSSLGFTAKNVTVGADQSTVNISLATQSEDLSEVVVTALGIKREKKMLTYASQQVAGDELRKVGNPNFMEALSGKAAGIDIKVSSSGAGGSTRAILRGNKSLTGLSEALYVIDGVPMVNNKFGQAAGSYGATDGGDGLSAINPNDIESINVLRGANASILYGSQGANGVILITTKKGRSGKATIDVNSNTVLEKVTSLPEFQFSYGAVGGGERSWSTLKSRIYQKDYINDFFQTGSTTNNSISISGGSDKTTAFFSYGNVRAKGIMPTNTYDKHNITLNQSTKVTDKLTVSSNVIFSVEDAVNRSGSGYYNNPLTGLYLFSRERDFDFYKNYYQNFNASRNINQMTWYSQYEALNNPYWEVYNNSKLDQRKRVIANLKVSYDIAKNLKFETRGNIDYSNVLRDFRYAAGGNPVSVSPNGSWNYSKFTDQSIYADAILTYNNKFGEFSVNALAGGSYQKNTFNDGVSVGNGTLPLMYPNYFTFSNMPYQVIFNKTGNNVLKHGAFANVQIGFKEAIFLDVSGRNDWASTLALTGNQSYFYPAVGLSAIISQMATLPEFISFMKLRASYSETGNEVPFNVVNPLNTIGGAGGPTGIGGINRNSQVPFENLKPEIIQANEFGVELKLFKNRIGIEATVYNTVSTNQFLSLPAPSGSGYSTYYVNAGKIINKGFEMTIDADVIRNRKLKWKTAINLSSNQNEIAELITSNPGFQVQTGDEGFTNLIKAGGSFNDVYIFKFNRNAAGQIILDAKGSPTRTANFEKVGNVNPDLIAGWNNTLTYKNFTLSALINGKFGGIAFSKTEAFLDYYGVSKRTGDARDAGTIPINAINGTTPVTSIVPSLYYEPIGFRNGIMEPYVYSRTNVRLGQLAIGYTHRFTKANFPIKEAAFSLIGRNLFFLYKDAPYDPEVSMSTSNNMQSNDVFALPPTRAYGFNVKLTF